MAFPLYRMRNLFGPNSDQQDQGSNPFRNIDFTPPEDDTSNSTAISSSPADRNSSQLLDTYGKLASMEPGKAQKAYTDFLATAPRREDYQPSKMQRVASILSGVAAGYKNPGAGVATMNALNDEPFNRATADYKDKAARLEKGAELEEKDINNRVKTYRDIEDFNAKQDTNARQAKYQDRMAGAAEKRANAASNKPSTYYTDPHSGHKFAVTFGDNGQSNQYDLGPVALTPEEKVTQVTNEEKAKEGVRQPNREKLIAKRGEQTRENIQARLKASKSLVDFKKSYPDFQFKITDNDDVVAFDKNDPTNVYDTGYKSNKLSDTERANLGLKNAKDLEAEKQKNREKNQADKVAGQKDVKAAPGADKSVEVKGNTATTTFKRDSANKLVPPTGYVRFRNKQDGRTGIIKKEDLAKHPELEESK